MKENIELGHDVHLVTRESSKNSILHFLTNERSLKIADKLKISVFDPFPKYQYSNPGAREYIYIYIWMISVSLFLYIKRLHKGADILHFITYGTLRFPFFCSFLPIRSIIGPLGGGETYPIGLIKGAKYSLILKEYLRLLSNYLIKISPLINLSLLRSDIIILKSADNLWLVPRYLHAKVRFLNDVGCKIVERRSPKPNKIQHKRRIKLLFVGRCVGWKGELLLMEIARMLIDSEIQFELCIIGEGPNHAIMVEKARKLEKYKNIYFFKDVENSIVQEYMRSSDLFVFPSMRDSGGTVIVECAQNGLPVLCFDCGGPGSLVDESWGFKIDVSKNYAKCAQDFFLVILNCYKNPDILELKRIKCIDWVKSNTWQARAIKLNEFYNQALM